MHMDPWLMLALLIGGSTLWLSWHLFGLQETLTAQHRELRRDHQALMNLLQVLECYPYTTGWEEHESIPYGKAPPWQDLDDVPVTAEAMVQHRKCQRTFDGEHQQMLEEW